MKNSNSNSKAIGKLYGTVRFYLINVCAVFYFLTIVVFAQTSNQPERGITQGGSYAIGDLETVNNQNGNLMFNFPLAQLPTGRGGGAGGISIAYNSKLWDPIPLNTLDSCLSEDCRLWSFYHYMFLNAGNRGGWRYPLWYTLEQINVNREMRIDYDTEYGRCARMNMDDRFVTKQRMQMPDGSTVGFREFNAYEANDNSGYTDRDLEGSSYYCDALAPMPGRPVEGQIMHTARTFEPRTYYSFDGSHLRLDITFDPEVDQLGTRNMRWTLSFPDGTRVVSSGFRNYDVTNTDEIGWMHKPQYVYDRNGNVTTTERTSGGIRISDSLGRNIEIAGYGSAEEHINSSGVGGEQLQWKVLWKNVEVNKVFHKKGNLSGSDLEPLHQILRVVDQIVSPAQAGSQIYKFNYNTEPGAASPGWGEVDSIILPAGAYVNYAYTQDEEGYLPSAEGVVSRRLIKKNLTYNQEYDGQIVPQTETTKYSGDADGGCAGHEETCVGQGYSSMITFPDGSQSKEYYDSYSATDRRVSRIISQNGMETRKIWARDNSLRAYTAGANLYLKAEFISIPDNTVNLSKTSIKDYNYDQNGNVTQIKEYDWVPYSSVQYNSTVPYDPIVPSNAQLKRVTVNSYYNETPDASDTNPNSPNVYWKYTAPYLRSALRATEIRNGNGASVSRLEFAYDNYSTTGNLTATRTWDSFKGGSSQAYSNPLTPSNSVSTQMTYDSYGNVTSMTDAKGTITQLTYGAISTGSGTVSGLYPTQTITAYGTSVARTSSAAYDFSTGLATAATDVDNNLTAATTYDALGRPTKTAAAVGTSSEIWTQTEYDDLNRRIVTRADVAAKGDGRKIAVQHLDQLGRVRLTRSLDHPEIQNPYNEADGIKVQTRYQTVTGASGAGYTYSLTSNPYRAATSSAASAETTMGWTRSKTVNTGKHAETEAFSGASLPAPWGGNSASTGAVTTDTDADRTLVTDQAGKRRISRTNALGQLTNVWEVKEADADTEAVTFGTLSLNALKTSYSYDTLNNLTTVNQGSQTRSFSYSSLARLLSAQNPESGTTAYLYDANGNLTQKTDARNVVTNYNYDALNRVTNRSYAPPSGIQNYGGTPTVTYTYDNLTNAKGKLTKVSSSVSTTEYTGFDILGRVTGHKQTTDGNAYTTGYSYNLSGALVEETYPSGRVVKNTLDANGDLAQVQSKKNQNTGYQNYAGAFTFTAAGAVSSLRLGNGRWESTQFNNRLQPTEIALGNVQNAANLLKLDYAYNTMGNADNNGNVRTQTITAPTVGAQAGFTAVQSYTYDSLNRIKDATEMQTASGQTWKQTFTYDRYGNRNFDTANNNTTTLAANCPATLCNPSVNAANNRFASGQGYSYDLAGNTTTDAENRTFVYDGENKQTEVKNSSNQSIGQYVYDGDGKRVKKKSASEETIFVYDAQGKQIAEYSTALNPTPQTSYLTSDHLGSPRINTDQVGNVISRHDYQPFGEEINQARNTGLGYQDDTIRKQFTAYERDNESGLDFAQARMLGSSVGRFTSPDPTMLSMNGNNPQSFNRYIYVMNNPLLYTDPLGLWAVQFQAVYKQKDGKDTTEIDHYNAVAVQTKGDKDTPAELARQLGLKGKEADKFVKNFGEKLADGKITGNNVQLSKLGGDVGRVFGIVQGLYSDQMKANAKGKGNPSNSVYADCSSTAANLNSPSSGANANGEQNWSVYVMDEYIKDNLKSIAEGDLRIGDAVRYATGEGKANVPAHFTTFIFRNDNGDPQVFSRSGEGGPFQNGAASRFTGVQSPGVDYGSIRGIGKDATGYYGRR